MSVTGEGRWAVEMLDKRTGKTKWGSACPTFETALETAKKAMATRQPDEQPKVSAPYEATEEQRQAFRALGMEAVWP